MSEPSFLKKKYPLLLGLLVTLGIILVGGGSPFGRNFVRVVVPGLLLLNSTQWLILPRKFAWRLIGFCISLSAAIVLLYLNVFSPDFDFANFVTILSLGMFVHTIALWSLASDSRTRNVIVAQSIAITFVFLVGRYLNVRHLEFTNSFVSLFLLWSPLAAMCLWVGSAMSNWKKSTQIFFTCIVVQIGVGLLDLGAANNLRWMALFAFIVVLAALGLLAYWSKDWRDEDRNDRAQLE